jgi:heptosyltransferase-2/heptosyltransferase-3
VWQNLTLVHAVLEDIQRAVASRHANWAGEAKHSHQSTDLSANLRTKGGWPASTPKLRFVTAVDDEIFAARWLKERNVQPHFCVILPGAGAAVKLWTAEGFSIVADALVERHGLDVVIAGAMPERQLVEDIRNRMRWPAATMVGLTVGQVAAVLRQSSLAIGLDSGIMHLAVALGVPSVHLYGPVDHIAFGPWGEPSQHLVVTSGYWCVPCNRLDYDVADLPNHPCVRLIDPEKVLAAAEQVLCACGK